MTTTTTSRTRGNRPHITNGRPRPGGKLARFVANHDTSLHPIIEDGLAYVSVEGFKHRRAILGAGDFFRITARDPGGPWLTRTRWWLDEDGHLRAFSLHDRERFAEGVLVAAAVLDAKAGDTIEVPSNPFDVRLSKLKRI